MAGSAFPRLLERWIRDALAEGDHTWDVRERLRTTQPTDDMARWHTAAFDYIFVWDEGRGHPFFPMIVMADGSASAPDPAAGFPDEARSSLATAVARIAHPLLRARYGDLLWVMRHSARPDNFAREAIDAYLVLLRADPCTVDGVDVSRRAVTLCLQLGDVARLRRCTQAVARAARGCLNAEAPPGVGIGFVQLLAELPDDKRPSSTIALARQADRLYGEDPFLADDTLEILTRVAPAETDELRRVQMDRWLASADDKTGLVKLEFLRRAREVADRVGRRADIERIDNALQSIPEDEMGMRTVSAEVNLPREQLEAYIKALVGEASYEEALVRIASQPVAAGDPDRTAGAVAAERTRHPLSFLATRIIQDSEGSIVWRATTDAQHDEAARYRHEAMGIGISGVLIAEALEGAASKFGLPEIEHLRTMFTTPFIPEEDASLIAEALHLHHASRYTAAAHLLVPRLERIIRRTLRMVGQVVTDFPTGPRGRGGVKSLGTLLNAAQGRLPEDLRVHLIALLTEPLSANLRNRIAHGLVAEVGREESAALIDVAARLRQLRAVPAATSD